MRVRRRESSVGCLWPLAFPSASDLKVRAANFVCNDGAFRFPKECNFVTRNENRLTWDG